jgi:hypothetical protein
MNTLRKTQGGTKTRSVILTEYAGNARTLAEIAERSTLMNLREAILAQAAFDERKVVDAAVATSTEYARKETQWTVFGPPAEVHEHGFYAGARFERDKLTPLLTRLVDEVEGLKAALERIKTHEVVGMPFTTIESLRLIADNATAAHQKRWEDLK